MFADRPRRRFSSASTEAPDSSCDDCTSSWALPSATSGDDATISCARGGAPSYQGLPVDFVDEIGFAYRFASLNRNGHAIPLLQDWECTEEALETVVEIAYDQLENGNDDDAADKLRQCTLVMKQRTLARGREKEVESMMKVSAQPDPLANIPCSAKELQVLAQLILLEQEDVEEGASEEFQHRHSSVLAGWCSASEADQVLELASARWRRNHDPWARYKQEEEQNVPDEGKETDKGMDGHRKLMEMTVRQPLVHSQDVLVRMECKLEELGFLHTAWPDAARKSYAHAFVIGATAQTLWLRCTFLARCIAQGCQVGKIWVLAGNVPYNEAKAMYDAKAVQAYRLEDLDPTGQGKPVSPPNFSREEMAADEIEVAEKVLQHMPSTFRSRLTLVRGQLPRYLANFAQWLNEEGKDLSSDAHIMVVSTQPYNKRYKVQLKTLLSDMMSEGPATVSVVGLGLRKRAFLQHPGPVLDCVAQWAQTVRGDALL